MKVSFAEMSKARYPFFIMFHPFDGFAELKYNKKASVSIASLFIFLWYVCEVLRRTATDFAFNIYRADELDLRVVALLTIALFLVSVIANWCFSTFMDGKGSFREIYTAGAYCLLPIIFATLITTFSSFFMVADEAAFLNTVTLVGNLWTVVLIIAAVQEMHDFNFGQTIVMLALTIAGVVLMLFLAFLVYSLAQQVVMFVINISFELIYRISMS